MEADPGTFDLARLQDYMRLGVTRFSVGVQSFNEVCSENHHISSLGSEVSNVAESVFHF